MTINKLVIFNQQDREHEKSTRWAVHANELPYINNDCTNMFQLWLPGYQSKSWKKSQETISWTEIPRPLWGHMVNLGYISEAIYWACEWNAVRFGVRFNHYFTQAHWNTTRQFTHLHLLEDFHKCRNWWRFWQVDWHHWRVFTGSTHRCHGGWTRKGTAVGLRHNSAMDRPAVIRMHGGSPAFWFGSGYGSAWGFRVWIGLYILIRLLPLRTPWDEIATRCQE